MARRPIVSDADRARVRRTIIEAEKRTSGEIFAVVAGASDDYRFIPLLWAALAALVLPAPLIMLTRMPALDIHLVQLGAFAVLGLLGSLPAVRVHLVPGAVKRRRAHMRAVEQFLAHNLHVTEARTGVLVYVSIAEHYAEIIADEGIAAEVGQAVWDDAIAVLTGGIAAGNLVDGLIAAIERVGSVLAEHFPPRPHDPDEIDNDLVIL